MKKQLHRIILASTSPRRKDLLSSIGLDFDVIPSDYEEDMTLPLPPGELTKHLSREKARNVAKNHPDAIIIGADTIVSIDETVLGKAHAKEDVQKMLTMLSGKTHQVITGMTIIIPASGTKKHTVESHVSINNVTFKTLSQEEIEWYIATEEPFEKAGAYAIQGYGGLFVDEIEGSYTGIVGLPIEKLYEIFVRHNIWPGLS